MATQKEINSGDNLLHYAILDDKTEFIEKVIGVFENDINAQNVDNNTPLHYACLKGNIKIVKLLVNNKANVLYLNKQGLSPLMMAIKNQYFFTVHFLLSIEEVVSIDKLSALIKIFQFAIACESSEIFFMLEQTFKSSLLRYN